MAREKEQDIHTMSSRKKINPADPGQMRAAIVAVHLRQFASYANAVAEEMESNPGGAAAAKGREAMANLHRWTAPMAIRSWSQGPTSPGHARTFADLWNNPAVGEMRVEENNLDATNKIKTDE